MPNHDTKSGRFQPDHQIAPIPAADGAPIPTTPTALLSRLSGEYPVTRDANP